jgi:flagellar hook-length control protein FliK
MNPVNLEEIPIKPIQEDVVTEANSKNTELMNLLNKLGIKEEDIKLNGEVKSDILQTIIEGINGDSTSNSNLSSGIEKLRQLLQTDSVKDGLDTDSLKLMQKLLSNISVNIADDNTKATKDIKSGIENLMSEISNVLDNKQNKTEKVLTIEDMLNKNYSQDNKESSTENETNNATASKASKEVSKEDKSLNSLLDDDKDSSLNKINLFASRTQTIQNQGVDTVRGLTINKATFADDLIKDVKFMGNNSLKELTVKINPGNLGEITIKLVQEDGVMKANLKANSKETTALLSQNLAEIKKQIGEQNIKIADVNIELYQDDTTFFTGQGFGRQLSQEQPQNSDTSNSENREINIEDSLIENIQNINNGNVNFLA